MFASTFLSYLLFATAALAAPRHGLNARIARRAGARFSGPRLPVDGVNTLEHGNVSNVDYSSNWAGTFVVPTPKAPSGGGSGTYSASAWVGIDGDTCGSAILQTGIDLTISGGSVSFDAWYEYFPDVAHDFSNFEISAGEWNSCRELRLLTKSIKSGNTITLTATATSATAGTVTIKNTVTKALTSTAKLCGENAEWIVEDYEEGSSLVPFANFGKVVFTKAQATTSSGTKVGPSGAAILDIRQNNKVLTSVTGATSNSVTIAYV
ncbi:Aspergillopepsin [Mycena sanguinolenta]|uniref:Aspergillopepsin n=1 Tax=Mycena sanguinolenta TaxID=230812 RepID=A0A8H7DEK4_9AGAR|nr:Aspergillopepsin [Mycena sanguinolenta]